MTEADKKRRRKGIVLISGFLLLVTAVVLLLTFNDPTEVDYFPPCPIYATTGTHCPGCGSTRATYALIHGDFYHAFDLNPLMVIFLPFVTYGMISKGVRLIWGKELPGPFLKPWAIWSLFGIIVLYWILRNLPWEPFTFLAP